MRVIMLLVLFCLGLFAVDINKATTEELKELKGIGAKKAEMIVKYRSEHKCFKNKEELLNVKGIGQGFLQKNEGQLTFSACK
ncbi:MAG: ComEA family DNA-binding protein [Arcobacter sp.]|uniref:ComEA family DNA-binding protein n=1 Tax=Arcobacter sp. TaxID=1872629 RepID=UPI003B005F51